jgi:hypothetical protein
MTMYAILYEIADIKIRGFLQGFRPFLNEALEYVPSEKEENMGSIFIYAESKKGKLELTKIFKWAPLAKQWKKLKIQEASNPRKIPR